jgi:hypothetical protein
MSNTFEPAPPAEPRNVVSALVALAGGGLIILGTLMPWVVVSGPDIPSTVVRSGMDIQPDGGLTLLLGIVIIGCALAQLTSGTTRAGSITMLLAAVGSLGVVVGDMHSIQQRITSTLSQSAYQYTGTNAALGNYYTASIGVGIGAIFVGAVLAAIGSSTKRQAQRTPLPAGGAPCLGCQAAYLRSKAAALEGGSGTTQLCARCKSMSMNAWVSIPASSSVRPASAIRCSRSTDSSWRACPKPGAGVPTPVGRRQARRITRAHIA